ncbi:MAG: ammonium transporter [Chitinophagaceae bacterium]|nr:ammonium transporter [Chitinophagaceae bacterium]
MSKATAKKISPFLILTVIAAIALFVTPASYSNSNVTISGSTPKYIYDSGDIAWMLVSSALVFLMTPALAFFYGGMVGRKNVLSTMIKSTVSAGIISVMWVVVLFSLCFGKSLGGFIGNPDTYLFFRNVMDGKPWPMASTIPLSLFAFFQLMFAIITPGLVVGAVAERIRFSSYTLFIVLFGIFVYAPLAHMVWHPDGLLYKWGVLDYAGGIVVHISAGMAALAGALVLRPRQNAVHARPANIPYVLIGTGLLWFGWFGFNAGSAMSANAMSVHAFATTNTAAGTAGLAWMFFDVFRGRKPSVLGFCIGAVVGLVAITPGAGFVGVPQAICFGFIAAVISNVAARSLSHLTSYDDPLDVFACHGLGGITGMLLTGIFGSHIVNSSVMPGQFWIQLKGMAFAVTYSFIVSFLIFKIINLISPIRVSKDEEIEGLDVTQHDEKYLQGTLLIHYKKELEEIEEEIFS